MTHRITRRDLLKSTAAAGALVILPSGLARTYAANEKLDIGVIGAGGRGGANLDGVSGENIVALCDVDRNRLNGAARKHPNATKYVDFRELLEKEKSLDAVVVSTPDHCHAVASLTAMERGAHCYTEKPLTHNIREARLMAEVTKKRNLITHMGTTGQSKEEVVKTAEAIRHGDIGDVTEVHCWTNRPIWPQGFDRPPGEDPVPDSLEWNLWLGPAPVRPFKATWPENHPSRKRWPNQVNVYHPFVWRGWQDFGTGAIGDIAPHIMNVAFWALELGPPESVEVVDTSGMKDEMFPTWSIVRYDFPARGGKPALKMYWYDGDKKPPQDLLEGARGGSSTLFVGTKGRIMSGGKPFPEKDFADYEFPEPTLPRRDEIHLEWIKCVKSGKPTGTPFEYAGPMTEAYLLGNIALKTGQRIEWNAKRMRIKGNRKANQLLTREYRKGWELPVKG